MRGKSKFSLNNFILFHITCLHWNYQSELVYFSFFTPYKTQETGNIVISNAYVDLVPTSDVLTKTPSEVGYKNWYLSHLLISE